MVSVLSVIGEQSSTRETTQGWQGTIIYMERNHVLWHIVICLVFCFRMSFGVKQIVKCIIVTH